MAQRVLRMMAPLLKMVQRGKGLLMVRVLVALKMKMAQQRGSLKMVMAQQRGSLKMVMAQQRGSLKMVMVQWWS
jgi:hypothetical protein